MQLSGLIISWDYNAYGLGGRKMHTWEHVSSWEEKNVPAALPSQHATARKEAFNRLGAQQLDS